MGGQLSKSDTTPADSLRRWRKPFPQELFAAGGTSTPAGTCQPGCRPLGIRADVSGRGTLGNRLRESRQACDAYLAIIGDDEVADRTVSVVAPGIEEKATLSSAEFIVRLSEEIRDRRQQPEVLSPMGV